MTEGEDLMMELFRAARESAARSTRLYDGDCADDAMWHVPEFGGEW